MAKRLSEKEKKEIVEFFNEGKTIQEIASKFCCTNLTVTRNLKKMIGSENFKRLINKNKLLAQDSNENFEEFDSISPFMEIAPLDCQIENTPQRDLSSVPIDEVDFPKVVFMIVDKKIELEIKYLKDCPNWQFLSQDELKRKTIEIYGDLKIAKSFCNKEQKVIKVPNSEVFKIVAPQLISRGISRIISDDKLIAL